MKRFSVFLTSLFLIAALLCATHASAGIKDSVSNFMFKRKASKAIESYTDNTVLKTIDTLVADIQALNQSSLNLKQNTNESNLSAACTAWHQVLSSFNKSQIFMYGPAAHYDFHKQLAIWPFDKILVDHAIVQMKTEKLKLNPQVLREKTASMRGLYTIKYLLFREGKIRSTNDITEIELEYLISATQVMVEEGIDFQASWIGTQHLSPEKKNILKKAGMKSRMAYAEEFKNPGSPNSRYFSVSVPLQELIQESTTVLEDMIPVMEELAHRDENNLKYWDSLDPYAELLDRLQGVENSYLGGVPEARGVSFSDLVAVKDAVLDDRIKTAFAHTAKRIATIRDLRNGPQEKKEMAIKVAIAECEKLTSRMLVATPLVTADPAVEPFAPYGSDL